MNEKEILHFIRHFTEHGEQVKDCFLYGNCYWFARILAQRFNGTVYYNPAENHFACSIKHRLYDISGYILNRDEQSDTNQWIPWRLYPCIDSAHAKRIHRDCIRLDT